MKKFLSSSMPFGLILALSAASVMAQQGQSSGQQQGQTQQLSGQQNQNFRGQGQQQPRVTGRVLLLKEVQQRNSGPHGVVLMQTDNGRTVIADLGPVSGLQNVPIRRNQTISVAGFPARIGNRLVFLVTDVQAGNQRARITRSDTGMQQLRPEYRQVAGNVLGTRQVNVRGVGQPNVLALVQTQGGQRVLVDLGSAQSLRGNLQRGQQIRVRGRDVRVGDRVILLASQAQVGNQVFDVNRPAYIRNRT